MIFGLVVLVVAVVLIGAGANGLGRERHKRTTHGDPLAGLRAEVGAAQGRQALAHMEYRRALEQVRKQ
jgi:hypothetical protein